MHFAALVISSKQRFLLHLLFPINLKPCLTSAAYSPHLGFCLGFGGELFSVCLGFYLFICFPPEEQSSSALDSISAGSSCLRFLESSEKHPSKLTFHQPLCSLSLTDFGNKYLRGPCGSHMFAWEIGQLGEAFAKNSCAVQSPWWDTGA